MKRQLRHGLIAAAMLALAACASAPKPSASQPAPAPAAESARSAAAAQARRSPYAPAQEDVSKRGDYTRGGLYAPQIKDTVPDYIPDVDAIPEPQVRDEPRSRYGNRSPYSVLGKEYSVLPSPSGYAERGMASYYGNKFHGRRTSNLEVYDMYAFTAAHRSLPLPSFARVTNLENGKSVVVRVNDRGPFHSDRLIDLSYAAAVKLGYRSTGTARVEVVGLSPDEQARMSGDAIARQPAAAVPPAAASAIDRMRDALPIASAQAASKPAPAPTPAPAPSKPAAAAPASDYRFDMRQDGKAMTADEFDAWMLARRVHVATGKSNRIAAAAVAAQASAQLAAATTTAASANTSAEAAQRITMQIAAFGNQQNATQALAMLQGAGIADARLLAGQANGQPIWRLRVGPMELTRAPELAARVAGLGFGQPQRVRD